MWNQEQVNHQRLPAPNAFLYTVVVSTLTNFININGYKDLYNSLLSRYISLRIMTHYHYEGWPDHGVPDAPTSMISFCKRAFSDNHPGPYIIHCSAGKPIISQ